MFKSFKAEKVDLLVIAGEASGDEHAAHLVNKLLKRHPNLQIAAMFEIIIKVLFSFHENRQTLAV